jgi:hypothetical protein
MSIHAQRVWSSIGWTEKAALNLMRRFFCFWWRCMRIAFWGNAAFANNWQWLVGIPTLTFLAVILHQQVAGTGIVFFGNPILDAVIAPVLAFALTWLFSFMGRMLNAPVRLYHAEHDRAEELDRRLTPQVRWDFSPDREACMPKIRDTQGLISRHVRVRPISEAEKSAGYLAQLRSIYYRRTRSEKWAPTPFDETYQLRWANEGGSMAWLEKGVSRYIDVCAADVNTNRLFPCLSTTTGLIPPRTAHVFEKDGFYRFDIALSGDGAPPPLSIEVEQTGRWDTIQARILQSHEIETADS